MVEKHNKTFNLKNGKTFASIKQLAVHLKGMSEDVYTHHVNKHKNDFANWSKFSMKNEKLAKSIEGHISKIEMELNVLRELVHNTTKTKITTKKNKTNKKK